MQSVHGEFRIAKLPNGRSRLQGTTWYRLRMSPGAYWTFYGDAVIHVIHLRVLKHIRHLSEAGSTPPIAHRHGVLEATMSFLQKPITTCGRT